MLFPKKLPEPLPACTGYGRMLQRLLQNRFTWSDLVRSRCRLETLTDIMGTTTRTKMMTRKSRKTGSQRSSGSQTKTNRPSR